MGVSSLRAALAKHTTGGESAERPSADLAPEQPRAANELPLEKTTRPAALPPLEGIKVTAEAERKQDNAAAVQQAIAAVEIFVDQRGEVRERVGSEAVLLDSQRGMNHIRLKVHEATGKSYGDDVLRREIGVLGAKAQLHGVRKTAHKRIGKTANGIVIDMGGECGAYVEDGNWQIRRHRDELFVRGPGYGDLPEPTKHESPTAAMQALNRIMANMGIPEIRRLMLIVALVNALRPGVPYVIILLIGGAGSGKTTTAGNLGGFIDPTTSGELPNVPLNAQDLAAVAQEHHALGVDNTSSIPQAASDVLCMSTHGTEFIVREFHTRKETTRLHVHCQFIITAITNPVTRGDLLDRTLPVTLEPHGDYKGEDEIRAWFKKVQPVAFGALLELLTAALAKLPEVKKQRRWTHRLVDFCQLGEAVVQACGGQPGEFVAQFDAMRRENAEEAASGDPVIQHVLDIVREFAKLAEPSDLFPPWRRWTTAGHYAIRNDEGIRVAIKASALREKVRIKAMAAGGRGWVPESDKQMADVLLQKKPTLAAINIQVRRELFNGDSGAAWVFSWAE